MGVGDVDFLHDTAPPHRSCILNKMYCYELLSYCYEESSSAAPCVKHDTSRLDYSYTSGARHQSNHHAADPAQLLKDGHRIGCTGRERDLLTTRCFLPLAWRRGMVGGPNLLLVPAGKGERRILRSVGGRGDAWSCLPLAWRRGMRGKLSLESDRVTACLGGSSFDSVRIAESSNSVRVVDVEPKLVKLSSSEKRSGSLSSDSAKTRLGELACLRGRPGRISEGLLFRSQRSCWSESERESEREQSLPLSCTWWISRDENDESRTGTIFYVYQCSLFECITL